MGKSGKWIITAIVLLVTGIVICGVSFGVLGFDLGKLSTVTYVTNTYDVSEKFQNISIDGDTENIKFVFSEEGKCRVVCFEEENDLHTVRVEDQTLTIEKKDRKGFWWNVSIATESPSITVYLPEKVYKELSIESDTGDVEIPKEFSFDTINVNLDTGDMSCLASAEGDIRVRTDTGHITIADVTASGMLLSSDTGKMELSDVKISGDLEIQEHTGKVVLENVKCRNFTSDGDTGSLVMTNVTASGEFNLERNTGDIEFHGCDAETIYVETDTGDVTGTLLTDKVFITETDTGSVDVPKSVSGGRCEISTDTGDIRIEIQ